MIIGRLKAPEERKNGWMNESEWKQPGDAIVVRLDHSCLIEGFLGRAGWEGQLETCIFYTEHTSARWVRLFPLFCCLCFLLPGHSDSQPLLLFVPQLPLVYLTVSVLSLQQLLNKVSSSRMCWPHNCWVHWFSFFLLDFHLLIKFQSSHL